MKKLYIFFLSLSLIPFAHGTDRVAQHKKSFGALYALAHANDLVIVPFNKAFVHVNKSLLCIHPLRDRNLITIYKETDTEITKMYLPINKFCEAVQKKQKEVLKEQKKILKKQQKKVLKKKQKEREEQQREFDGQLFTAIKENASLEEIQKLLESGVKTKEETPLYIT